MHVVFGWLKAHELLLFATAALSLFMFAGSLILVPLFLVRIPADYFRRPHAAGWFGRHPAVRLVGRVAKNVVGFVLVLAGIAMLVLPGQGLVTIVIGLSLVDFPGKRRLEIRLIRQPRIHGAIDWLRRRAGQPSLQLPEEDER